MGRAVGWGGGMIDPTTTYTTTAAGGGAGRGAGGRGAAAGAGKINHGDAEATWRRERSMRLRDVCNVLVAPGHQRCGDVDGDGDGSSPGANWSTESGWDGGGGMFAALAGWVEGRFALES